QGISAERSIADGRDEGHGGDLAGRGQAQVHRWAVEQRTTRRTHPNPAAREIRSKKKSRSRDARPQAKGHEGAMRKRRWLLPFLLAGSMAAAVSGASAQETLKLAVGQLGLWAVDAPRLGQRAGIFKKHGLVLDIFGTSGGGDTLQAVISGSADLTVGIGTAAVLRAYSKGAPVRVIGANFT